MHPRNELRLLAGIAIDSSLEVTIKQPPQKLTESGWSSGEVVTNLDDAYARLESAVKRRDKQAIDHISAELEELEVQQDDASFDAGRSGQGGLRESKKTRKAKKDFDGDGKVESDKDEVLGSRMKAAKKAGNLDEGKKAKKDWDGDGEVESEKAEHDGVVDKAIAKSKKKTGKKIDEGHTFSSYSDWEQAAYTAGNSHVKFEDDDSDGRVKAVADNQGHGYSQHGGSERTIGIWDDERAEGVVFESTLNYSSANKVTWEEDESEPVNVSGQDDNTVWEPLNSDKNESPSQLDALGNQSSEEHDKTVNVPAKLLSQLMDVVTGAREEADKWRNSYSRYETTKFYDDYANACEQLHDHLKGGTVGDIKKAQIHMSSLMGPMLHKIPDDVNDFVMRGGQNRSLKDHFTKVQGFPIEGPRNKLS